MNVKKHLTAAVIFFSVTITLNAQLVKSWETKEVYKAPESAAYDQQRGFIYASNLVRGVKDGSMYGDAFISKSTKTGDIVKLEWITGLTAPTGICIFNDQLYIVERFGVVVYDLKLDAIVNKYLIGNNIFINDITVGSDTSIYVTDSGSKSIYKIKNGNVEKWLESDDIANLNGILFDHNKLIIGCGDQYLKSVDIQSKAISKIAFLGDGSIDGIQKCGEDYLVSHFQGNIYLVTGQGEVKELVNTREQNLNIADIDYVENEGLIIVPALWNNKMVGYIYKND